MFHMAIQDEGYGRLPYAGVIIKIFKLCGVDLFSEPSAVMNEHHAIGVSVINPKMGVKCDEDAEKITYLNEDTTVTSQDSNSSNQMLMDYMVELRHDMMQQFKQMSIRFDSQQMGYNYGEDLNEE